MSGFGYSSTPSAPSAPSGPAAAGAGAERTTAISERFELLRKLGTGAFGTVYEAFDRQYGCVVALKQLRRGTAEALHMFKREFRALADIAHQNLVALYELVAEPSGDWFLEMEFIDGVDFLSFVSPGPTPGVAVPSLSSNATQDLPIESRAATVMERLENPALAVTAAPSSGGSISAEDLPRRRAPVEDYARLLAALRQLATGLSALHAAGKLHRDIKPATVPLVEKLASAFPPSSKNRGERTRPRNAPRSTSVRQHGLRLSFYRER